MLNYDQMYDELEKTQKLLTNEIMKINEKGDLTPGELNSLKEAVCVMKDILKLDEMIEGSWDEGEEDGYSEYSSRGGQGSSGRGSYRNGSSSREGGSYYRGRSARTGRFVSRENEGSYRGGSMRGSSRHSLQDRMAANLESMMDEAGSEFERQKIGEWIDKIRNAPENE